MYLTKLLLDPHHPQARRDLANAYEMHRTLCRAYAEHPQATPDRFLWRLESSSSKSEVATVLVQSARRGDWSAIQTLPGYFADAHPEVDLSRFLGEGRHYRFRLLANPTVTRAGKRYGLHREEDQLAWLARQAEQHGFALCSAMRSLDERRIAYKGRQRLTVQAACFDGILRARDVARMQAALLGGIGHAKALGLGLLSVAPADASAA